MTDKRIINEEVLEKLVNAPSPTGYEQPAQQIVRDELKDVAEKIETDVMGNVIATLNSEGKTKIMLAGHVDEVGMQVKYINKKGFIYFHQLGGLDSHLLPGNRVKVLTNKGELLGVIGKKAIHMQKPAERKRVIDIQNQYIDIGASSLDEVEEMGVRIGDPIIFEKYYDKLGNNGLVVSRCFDDKIGTFIIMEILKLLKGKEFDSAVYGVSTTQEEIGMRGANTSAFGIEPQVGIAYDVTFASDTPDMKELDIGIVKMGGGPVIHRGPNINPILFDLIVETAKELDITIQINAAHKGTGTDGNIMQVTRSGVAVAVISIPNRYMHSMSEVVHLDDVDEIVRLSVAVIMKIKNDTSFIPH